MTTTMTDLRDGRTYVFNEALPGRDAYEDALAQGFEGTRAAWLASLRGFAFDPASADWEVDRPYAVNAAIRHQHKIWVAKLAHEGVTPGTDPEVWQLLLDGASALELSNAVAAALAHQGAAETAAGLAEAKRAAAAAILNATLDAAAALTPIDALHPVSLPIPAGWWDTGDRLLSGASERAIICNWAHEILAPAALWRGTLPASLRAATDGTGEAAVGGTIARINDSSGNALHLTQASTSLRPIRGRRPKTGIRNRLRNTSLSGWNPVSSGTAVLADPQPNAAHVMYLLTGGGSTSSRMQLQANPVTPNVPRRFSALVAVGTSNLAEIRVYNSAVTTQRGRLAIDLSVTPPGLLVSSGATDPAVEADLGDGLYRVSFAVPPNADTEAAALVYPDATGGSGSTYFGELQLEDDDEVTAWQAVGPYSVTETGVESVSFAAFDLVDDAMNTGAIAGGLTGQAFVAGDGGCYVRDLVVAAGGTFFIGSTANNWTGAAPGILRAVTGGTGRVLDAMIRDGAYTEDEIARLERYYRALGGKGLLVSDGVELVTNGGFNSDLAGWAFDGDGSVNTATWHPSGAARLVSDGSIANKISQAVPLASGVFYLLTFDLDATTGGVKPWDGDRYVVFANSGTHSLVVRGGGSTGISFPRNSGATDVLIDNVSVQRLIPREDL